VYRRAVQKKIQGLLLGLTTCVAGCGIQPPPSIRPGEANVASLDPQNWYIFYSSGVPLHPSADPTGAWSFEFPSTGTGGHVNYIQTPFNVTAIPDSVTITFRIENNRAQYAVNDPTDILPATIHVFFEQQNDNLRDPNGRWWATASKYNLGSQDNTTITFTVPLTPDQWSNVYGQRDSSSFYAALSNVGWIGMTCGGQYFFGHGVGLSSGSAKYVLAGLKVN